MRQFRLPGSAAVSLIGLLLGTCAFGFQTSASTVTPIKHLVVIFQENNSFDHYFATYPNAANPPGEPAFVAKPNTPGVNGSGTLLGIVVKALAPGSSNISIVQVNAKDSQQKSIPVVTSEATVRVQ